MNCFFQRISALKLHAIRTCGEQAFDDRVPDELLHPSLHSAPKGLLPLSTVHITWGSSVRHTVYTLPQLYAYLTRFGPLEAVYQRSPNSALAVFCDLASARDCVISPELGLPWDRLIARWWEPRMANRGYLAHQLRQEEHNIAEAKQIEQKKKAPPIPEIVV
ncbi:hypothetical protein PoB_003181500 [Plakobranchus ocellatus]|uniref:RRM domain-containing protein n=1 Tax=Plakobranchus ocellatus TaxID=259542 RepID=A0AAV4AEW9_9GAST|nr:hypothetical protein PoB_003181500 [Plakobranchus ocellatus]